LLLSLVFTLSFLDKTAQACTRLKEAFQGLELLKILPKCASNLHLAYVIGLLYTLGSKDGSYKGLIPKPIEYYVKKFTQRLQEYHIEVDESHAIINFFRSLNSLGCPEVNDSVAKVCLQNKQRNVQPPSLLNAYIVLLAEIQKRQKK